MSFVNHLHRHHDLGRGRSRSGVRGRNSEIETETLLSRNAFQFSRIDSSRLDDRPATLNLPPFGMPPVRAPKPDHFLASFERQSADVTNLPDWLDDQPVPGEAQPSVERHVTEERR
jgi:hypothetical protein